jgi:hypothetical protein
MSEFNKISELLDNTNLSNEELRELKYKIVGQLRLNQEVNTRTLRYKLREGAKVKINTPDGNRKHRGQVLEGEVTKVNRTTAIVEVDTMTYKVSLDLLELV